MRRRWPGSWPATTESLGKTAANEKINPEVHFSGFFIINVWQGRLANLADLTVHIIQVIPRNVLLLSLIDSLLSHPRKKLCMYLYNEIYD